jgi:TrmH family RNA methyltransferase
MLDRVRIVLVRPIRGGNVGAACRAMANMGLSDLAIVAPQCDVRGEEAVGFAARARALLASARIVATIAEALDGCVATFATTGKGGFHRKAVALPPDEAARLAVQNARTTGRVAFVFGPEDRGLVLEELLQFDRIVEIPADSEYPVLNLAAAVLVICYELRLAALSAADAPRTPSAASDGSADPGHAVAPDERKRIVYEKLFDALDAIGFFRNEQSPHHLRLALRRLFGRLDMTVNEADILIGMARQVRWFAGRNDRESQPSP